MHTSLHCFTGDGFSLISGFTKILCTPENPLLVTVSFTNGSKVLCAILRMVAVSFTIDLQVLYSVLILGAISFTIRQKGVFYNLKPNVSFTIRPKVLSAIVRKIVLCLKMRPKIFISKIMIVAVSFTIEPKVFSAILELMVVSIKIC